MDPAALPLSRIKKMVYAVNYIDHPRIINPDNLRRDFEKFFQTHPVVTGGCTLSVSHEKYDFDWCTTNDRQDGDEYLNLKKQEYTDSIEATVNAIEGDNKIILSYSSELVEYTSRTGVKSTTPYIYFYVFYQVGGLVQYSVISVRSVQEGDFFGGGCHFYEFNAITPSGDSLIDVIRKNPTILPHLVYRYPADDLIRSF